MIGFNHLFILLSVFGVMLTAITVLPPLFVAWKERRQTRMMEETPTRSGASAWANLQRAKQGPLIVGALLLGGIIYFFTNNLVPLLTLTVLTLTGPGLLKKFQRERRTNQFDAQLLDGLILVNNALKSGLDIATGIELIANNMKPPISEEFNQALNAYRLGAPLEVALRDMTLRIPSRALETAVSSIVIQRETGGNLIRTFEQLIITIREESKLQRKIQAISAQGRTQVGVLAFFPWAIGLLFFMITPETMQSAIEQPVGQLTLVGLLLWEGVGLLVTKKIVTVDV